MKIYQLLVLVCTFFVHTAFAQDNQANVPNTAPAPLTSEMTVWLEYRGGSSDETGSLKSRSAVSASFSWNYPTVEPSVPYGGGSGTKSDPYIINTPQHLANLAYMVNNGNSYSGVYFKMTNNIVLNSGVLKSNGSLGDGSYNTWTPIGTSSYSFKGNFDGGCHAVWGIYINSSSKNYQGLFGRAADGSITNLGVEDSYIYGYDFVGGVLGHSDRASLNRCYSAATVTGHFDVGGIVGDDYGGGGSAGTVSSSKITT